jgi:translocation and assembly module TamA
MKLRGVLLCVWLVGLMALPVAAQAAWYWPFGTDTLAYKVEFAGIDAETFTWLKEVKLDEATSDTEVTDREMLDRELVVRGGRVRQALQALGYYDALVVQDIRDGEVPVLVYRVQTGVRARIARVTVDWQGKEPLKDVELQTLGQKRGDYVNAKQIVADATAVLDTLGERACVLRLNVTPQVKLYDGMFQSGRRAEIVYVVDKGDAAVFGATTVLGNKDVRSEVILRQVNWREGRCFKASRVTDTQEQLMGTQLFSVVSVTYPATADASGTVPMTIGVTERAPRTLRAGMNFGSDVGFAVTGGWEHRNLMGSGEKFTVSTKLGQEEIGANTSLRLPAFWHEDQDLVLGGSVKNEDSDAYKAMTLEGSARLERKLARHWKGSLGVGYRLTESEDSLGDNTYGLLSFPGFLEYDDRRDVMDPRRGLYANLSVTPYKETFGDGGDFVKTQMTVQTYVSAPVALSPTLALKLSGGTIYGAKESSVPSDVRFYAGGGGSVRGYGYQSIGPRGSDNNPIGGSSFVVGSAEVRTRFTNDFGFVTFVDAGNVYDQAVPEDFGEMYVGVGAGLRYYTAIGPIRLDVGVPMNGKDVGAEGYAVYVSIGQSF